MESIETLLKIEMGQKFDTRKTLNRSDSQIQEVVLEQIESGNMTCELIDALVAAGYPIFRYWTQITIHGNFEGLIRSHIGGYKNLFLNGNGSLGVRYGAIDTKKVNMVENMLEAVRNDFNGFHYSSNSTERMFRKSCKITPENRIEKCKEYMLLANKIKEVGIYGFVNCYIQQSYFGGYILNLEVHPLAIPENQICALGYALCEMTASEYGETLAIANEKRTAEAEKRAAADLERKNEQQRLVELKEKLYSNYRTGLGEFTSLTENNIVVKFSSEEVLADGKIIDYTFSGYVFYRLIRGSFNRWQVQRARCLEISSELIWDDYNVQKKLNEINIKGYLLPHVVVQVASSGAVSAGAVSSGAAGAVRIVKYSDKSFAVIGETKPIKEILKSAGGCWNSKLSCGMGWIFPLSKLANVERLVGISLEC